MPRGRGWTKQPRRDTHVSFISAREKMRAKRMKALAHHAVDAGLSEAGVGVKQRRGHHQRPFEQQGGWYLQMEKSTQNTEGDGK